MNNGKDATTLKPEHEPSKGLLDDATCKSVGTETTRESFSNYDDATSISSSLDDHDCSQNGWQPAGINDNAAYLRDELYGRVQKEPELFEWMQKAALDGMWYWDLENSENEWLSPEFKELFGYSDEEVPNTSSWWQENIFPQDKVKAIELFQKHVTEGVPYDSIVRYRHKNGSTVWVRCRGKASFNEQGQPVRMLGAHSDVTRLMEVQEELKKKEAVLDLLCTTALDGFWDWNIKTGEDFLSTRWKKALGYEEEDIQNTVESWRALLHPDDVSKAKDAVKRHMELGESYSVVLRYKRKDGTYAHMLSQGVAQKDDQGEWVRMFGTHTDVSYLEEARAARQASEAKTTFLATMSHEIRTPLNAVLGMATALQATTLTAEQQDCVETLTNSGKHLLALINDILDFSQIEAGLVNIMNTKFSVQETVREVVNALQLTAKSKGIAITFDTSVPPGAQFVSDAERLRQIAFNLCGNAVKFTKEGTVNVSLAMEDRDGLSGVKICVQDTGCGMAKEHLTRIFEDFTQANSEVRHQYGGSGLGLSISKKLVAALGGSIVVESQLRVGSTFTVWLPGFLPAQESEPPTADSEKGVLLYEELPCNKPSVTQGDKNECGSVAKAIRATGRAVIPVSNVMQLQEHKESRISTIVCVLNQDTAGEQCNEIVRQLVAVQPRMLLDVGRRIDPKMVLPSKILLRSLQAFPTTDEVQQAIDERPAEISNRSSLSTGFALCKMGRDMRILLAEDNAINVKVMRKLLGRFPCKVEVACNGQQAIEKARSGSWDLILMDMIMPELDGVDATKGIRKFDQEVYIVALTANATVEDRDHCLAAGMNEFLSKPVSMPALGRVLSQMSSLVAKQEEQLCTVGRGGDPKGGRDSMANNHEAVPEALEAVARLLADPSG